MKDEVEKILLRLESQAWAHIDNSDRVETALSKILALQDKAQVEAVRAELEDRIETLETAIRVSPDGDEWNEGRKSAWRDDITDHEERLAELTKEDGETK